MNSSLEEIELALPLVDESYEWQDIQFKIYLAKNFFENDWKNQALRDLVFKCRKSFHRYGNVAVEDRYDSKSLVCVVGVSYLVNNRLVKEWLTIRLVPAQGEPYLSEDLQVEFEDEKNLFELIKEKLLDNQIDSPKRLYTISRFCGITPYYLDNFQPVENESKIKFTALSFVLLSRFSLKYIPVTDIHNYITAMFHHDIFDRAVLFRYNDVRAHLSFPDTHETLSLHPDLLKVFSPGAVAFRHPTYFFKIREFVNWVKKMILEDNISVDTLRSFLKTEIEWEETDRLLLINKLELIKKLSALGDMLSGDEVLINSVCTRKELRSKLEEEVPMSLVLKLAHQSDLEVRIDKFLVDINFK